MKEIRARALTKRWSKKFSDTHRHTHTEREKVPERAKESRVAGRRLFLREEVLFDFFLFSCVFFPKRSPLCQKRQFLRKREKKNVVNDKDGTQKKSYFDDTARRRRSSWNHQRSRVLREEPGRGGSRAFARVRIYR